MKMNRLLFYLVVMLSQCRYLGMATLLHPMDFLALQSIRKSLDDFQGSTFFSNWDFTSDPCNFTGVFCQGDRVVSLNLGDPRAGSPGLIGRLDPALGRLSALVRLTVLPGHILSTLPSSLSQCKNLRFLAVTGNFLSGNIPDTIADLRSLHTLDLSYNLFIGQIPNALGSLPSLTNLILSFNKLSGSVPHFVSQSLTKVDLKHNYLSGSISPLPNSLQYLSLSSNRLYGPVGPMLPQLTQLNHLDLSLNNFNGPIPSILFTFPITNLHLQRNSFSGNVLPDSQVTIPTVDLSFNRLYGRISPMFATVQNLYLNNNRFTGEVPSCLIDRLLSADIQLLYLQHNFLTGMQISPAAEIPVRSSLCLQYNCMVPPVQTTCPMRSGKQKTRPASQCAFWKKLTSSHPS